MLTLNWLRVDALKVLRDLDCTFPQHGSVLIEGPNESGKSTLFEAIYFALYGRALVGEEISTRPPLVNLIPHDYPFARVSLTLAVDDGELEVMRELRRSRTGAHTQQVALTIRRSGQPIEFVNAIAAANARIEQELRGLDADTFRNSLFMEQKGLERLELMSRSDRDKAVSRLLGLERLQEAEKHVGPAPELLARRDALRQRLGLVEHISVAREARARAESAELQARAAEVRGAIRQRDALAAQQTNLRQRADDLQAERATLQIAIDHHARLIALERELAMLEALRVSALSAAREADGLAARLSDFATAERLPEARRRLAALSALEERLALASEHVRQLGQRAEAAARHMRVTAAHARASQSETLAERTLTEQKLAFARGRLGETLAAWARAREAHDLQMGAASRLAALRADHAEQQLVVAQARRSTRGWLFGTLSAGVATLLAAALGLRLPVFWLIAAILVGAGVISLIQWRRAVAGLSIATQGLAGLDRDLVALTAEVTVTRRLSSAGLDGLQQCEAELRTAGEAIPASPAAARARLAELTPDDSAANQSAQESALRAAESALARARFVEEQTATEVVQAQGEWRQTQALAGLAASEAPELVREDEMEAAQRAAAAISSEARALDAPDDLAGLAAARAAAEATVATLAESTGAAATVAAQLTVQRDQAERARMEWAAALAELAVSAGLAQLPRLPYLAPDATLADLAARHDALAKLLAEASDANEPSSSARDGAIGAEIEQIAAENAHLDQERVRLVAAIAAQLVVAGVAASGDEPLAELAEQWPLLTTAPESVALADLLAARDQAGREAYHAEQSSAESARAAQVAVDGLAALDSAALQDELATVEREIRQRELAVDLARATRSQIIRRALPETEAYMRAILPSLTLGRYRDVALTDSGERTASGSVDLNIRMWDQIAGRYVRKNLFSGGARDQASLALRLAFALATLPRGRGATPGFIFLDEPLSAFDAERSRALAQALTHGPIAAAFPQIFLISHSQIIDPRDFDYILRLEDGRTVESTLPTSAIVTSIRSADEDPKSEALMSENV
jgi:DNA repair exonuclease SbcCD ATPase subunit